MRTGVFMDIQDFYDGNAFDAYEYLGANTGKNGVTFRTYAPHALDVSLIGSFSKWKEMPMHRVDNGEFWELTTKKAKSGDMYKFRIYRQDGTFLDHADPYAFYSELRPGTASVVYDRHGYQFHDDDWMWMRRDRKNGPMNIYEIHLGSWRRSDDPDELSKALDLEKNGGPAVDVSAGWYSYADIAEQLIPYLQENHYNYLEIMPLSEFPADESWGYQTLGFFSATSRYGDPDGLKKLIDECHQHNIGVILDIVTVHFAPNDYGLRLYDGTPVYEYPAAGNGISEWGTVNFNHSKGDVRSFLSSMGEYWLHDFHFDGLRYDAVGNLIYWQGSESRGLNAIGIEFLKGMNAGLKAIDGNVILIAEDSSSYPGVTHPVSEGGLGFDYKWDMGWMNDTLNYFRTDPPYRVRDYHRITFSMMYFYNENYLLPLSHDEVVHGKASIMQKMAGPYEKKFPQARALYIYMYTHPGKKLNFMGNEIGQMREWDEKKAQDWFLTRYPLHDSFHRFITDLSALYIEHPAFWERDYRRDGFEWIDADDDKQCIYVYRRRAESESIMCIMNFSDFTQTYHYSVGGPQTLQLLLDSDNVIYSGTTENPPEEVTVPADGIYLALKPFEARIYLET